MDPDYFPLKDLTLESFLAKQVVQRVRFAAPKPAEGASPLPTELVDGRFIDPTEAKPGDPAERVFEFSIVSFESVQPEINVLRFLKVANQVLKGYEFTDFDRIEIKDLLSRKMLLVDRETLTLVGHWYMPAISIIIVGVRGTHVGPIAHSFAQLDHVEAAPIATGMVDLKNFREQAILNLGGTNRDVAIGIILPGASTSLASSWAAFNVDDSAAVYDVQCNGD